MSTFEMGFSLSNAMGRDAHWPHKRVRSTGGGGGGEKEEEELPAIGTSPVQADSRERVPTPHVSTTRIGMQEHRLD